LVGHLMSPVLQIEKLSKTYRRKLALDGVSLTVGRGELVALLGASGSGKSTLLRCANGLVLGDRGGSGGGEVWLGGRLVQRGGRLGREARAARAQTGFIFQQFQLVRRLPVLTNVLCGLLGQMPGWRSFLRWFVRDERERAWVALGRMGLAETAWRRASQLSGGQQQRVAIARALAQGAEVILADEPIASLDPKSARRIMEILRGLNRQEGVTVVVSLHQVDMARRYCDRIVALQAGKIVYDGAAEGLAENVLDGIYAGGEMEEGEGEGWERGAVGDGVEGLEGLEPGELGAA